MTDYRRKVEDVLKRNMAAIAAAQEAMRELRRAANRSERLAARVRESMPDCDTCGSGQEHERCPNSQKSCGHHCDHTWTHDTCCWCGAVFGDVDDPDFGKPRAVDRR